MWRRHRRGDQARTSRTRPDPDPAATDLETSVVVEARALVEGRLVDELWAEDRPIPDWAWLNALAHRPKAQISDLVWLACDHGGPGWAEAVIDIAFDLLQIPDAEAATVQTELLVPAELDALACREHPGGPNQLVRAVRRRLAEIGDGQTAGS